MPSEPNNKPEMSMERRMMLAFALMMLTLLASQYFFKPAPGPKSATPSTAAGRQSSAAAAKPAPAPVAAADEHAPAAPSTPGQTVAAYREQVTVVDTDVFHLEFTNRGAAVRSWVLKQYRDTSTGKPQQLVNTAATGVPLPLSIDLRDAKLPIDLNTTLFVPEVSADGLTVQYRYAGDGIAAQKSFRFTRTGYLCDVRTEVLQNGYPLPHLLVWRGGFGDQHVRNAVVNQHTVHYDAGSNKLITKTAKDAKNGPVSDSGSFTFGGLEDTFFAAVALPVEASALELRTYSDQIAIKGAEGPQPYVGSGIATGPRNQLQFFVGPKDVDVLRRVNPKLTQLIDWGTFGLLAKPLFISLTWVHDHWTRNYGWAIIAVTIIINLLLFPFKLSSLKSARKMQALQPRLQQINEKYKSISMRDPRKADQNQETMALYKEAGVNPLGGCLPLLLQLPFFYAFYRVLNIAIALRGASWLWVPDLSQAESLPIHLLPLILIATQFFTQKLTPASGVDPNQQRMMMLMPLVFGFMFYSASAGLVLYWLTSNLVGIGQQLLINRIMPPAVPPAPPAPPPVKAPVKRAPKR